MALESLRKSETELHCVRKANTEMLNLRKLDLMEQLTRSSHSANLDTIQVYSINAAGGVCYYLPMERKIAKREVVNSRFSSQKKHRKSEIDSAY